MKQVDAFRAQKRLTFSTDTRKYRRESQQEGEDREEEGEKLLDVPEVKLQLNTFDKK